MRHLACAFVLSLLAGHAAAQGYVGGLFGFTQQGANCANWSSCDKTDTGVKFYGGYRFTNTVAAEVGFVDFGSVSLRTGGGATGSYSASAVTLGAAFSWPLAPRLTGVARAGVAMVDADYRVNGPFNLFGGSESDSSLQPYVGAALSYSLSPRLSLTGSLDLMPVDYPRGGGTAMLLGVGLAFSF